MIGPPLVRAASAAVAEVIVVNRSSRPPAELGNVRHIAGDRGDPETLTCLSRLCPDVVIDVSGYVPQHVGLALDRLCGLVARYVVMSSGAVYEPDDLLPWDESRPLGAASFWGRYGADKCAIERLLAEYRGQGTELVTLRAPYLVGHPDFMHRLQFIADRVVHDGLLFIPDHGDAAIQLASPSDAAAALLHLALATLPGGSGIAAFNLGTDGFTTLAGLVRLTAQALEAPPPRLMGIALSEVGLQEDAVSLDERIFPFANRPLVLADSRLRSTGFRPSWDLPALLAEFVADYRDAGGPFPPVHHAAELRACRFTERLARSNPEGVVSL